MATLVPGAPFKFVDRYAFTTAPGVGPNMARFSPANVDTIPSIRSGDIVAVQRQGQVSRARLVGVAEHGTILFRPQAGRPFTHAFALIPWSAWNASADTVQACAEMVAEQWFPCVVATNNGDGCTDASAEQLGECASGQADEPPDPEPLPPLDMEFICLEPRTAMGEEMTMGGADGTGCAGEFWGTITEEPGFFGCEEVYDGTWTADDPDCNAGPADVIVLSS